LEGRAKAQFWQRLISLEELVLDIEARQVFPAAFFVSAAGKPSIDD
jgi:hypothetical protein